MSEANGGGLTRRQVSAALAAVGALGGGAMEALAQGGARRAGRMLISGPIPVTATSRPFGAADVPGSSAAALLREFDYVEEEYFASGTSAVYGPVARGSIKDGHDFFTAKALSRLVRTGVPYKTRLLVVRPRDPAKFSGNVYAVGFHNLGASSTVERHILRNGDAWIGIEASNGTRFGPKEELSGGVAHLHKFNRERYGELSLPGGADADWPDLTPGNRGKTSADLNFGVQGNYAMGVFLQEIHRGYAQGPDILTQLAHALKIGRSNLPLGRVRRTFSYGASGGTTLLTPYIEYHHDRSMLPDGRPPFDGYLVMVGQEPPNRPRSAVMAFLNGEGEAMGHKLPVPRNTDNPRFRYYEIPGTGHSISAPVETASAAQRSVDHSTVEQVLPKGIAGLTARGAQSEYEEYDKINAPITWGIWANMKAWLEQGRPMPSAEPILRDPAASDGIARDEHGNAKGGLRTPWVDVPEARYVARISKENPLRAGMKRFGAAKINALYGSREAYVAKCTGRVDQMVRDRWIQPIDAALMKRSCK